MLRRNGPVIKPVESVLRLQGMVGKICKFVREVDLKAGVKERGEIMDCESGELSG